MFFILVSENFSATKYKKAENCTQNLFYSKISNFEYSSQPLFYIVQFSTNYSLFKYALYKKVTICALLQISSGEKVLSVVPLVIPLPNAHVRNGKEFNYQFVERVDREI